jgi:uncharacterized damage-inducible protein DinB
VSNNGHYTIIDDLYRYNSWANDRIFALCDGLTDDQLDAPHEIGLGSLRNTLFHILAAEEIWLERWSGKPWRPFPLQAEGLPLAEMARRLQQVAADRQALVDRQRPEGWQRVCQYKDSKGNSYRLPLRGLLVHVANHGIHHRAQALQYLKRCGRTVPGGLDYLFFRIAKPHHQQEPATAESLRQYGLEVATGASPAVGWDANLVRNYFAYGDWANARLLPLVAGLDDAALDRPWGMGMDTLRKTLLHIADAERWWLRNWTTGPTAYERAPETTSIAQWQEDWAQMAAERNRFIEALDEPAAQRVVTALVGPMTIRVAVIESLVQLGGHGTHHRAQLINMLRHTGQSPPGCDYSLWLLEQQSN